jgi:glycine hydroxymethyltransferase
VADFLHEGIQIAINAKKMCPGTKIKDFLECVESESCQQHAAIVNLRQRVKAFATQYPIPGVGTEDLLAIRKRSSILGYKKTFV